MSLSLRRRPLWAPSIPRQIASCKLWLDVMDFAALGATDGFSVTNWADKSGNGKTFTQGTAGRKPTFKTAILGSKPALLFDTAAGAEDVLACTTAPVSVATDNFTMWIAAAVQSGTNNGSVLMNNGAGNNGYGICSRTAVSTFPKGIVWNGLLYVNSTVAADTAWCIYCMSRSSGTTKLWVNGGASVLSSAQTPNTPGTSTQIGAGLGGAAFNPFYMVEAMHHDIAMSIAQINRVGNYLAKKWGLTWATAS